MNNLTSRGYNLNERRLKDLKKVFSRDYHTFEFSLQDEEVAYLGYEHKGDKKLPNITILPNLKIPLGVILGSTFGHQHLQKQKGDLREYQEL